MTDSPAVVRQGSPRHRELVEAGWQVSEESFGAQLDAGPGMLETLDARAAALDPALRLRPLTADDVEEHGRRLRAQGVGDGGQRRLGTG